MPPLYAHGDPDARPLKSWLIKRLIPAVGHGLLSGQWGAGKTFVVFDLAAALVTGQPFIGHAIKRRCGVLLIAAEGADEVRLRLDAVVREKCGGMPRAPFRWYETAPLLLHKGSAEMLIAMARQADESLQEEFGLPLGLIVIDTIAACAGYAKAGDENDPAAGQAVMNVLKVSCARAQLLRAGGRSFRQELRSRHPGRLQQGSRRRSRVGLPGRQGTERNRRQHQAGGAQEPRRSARPGIPVCVAGRGGVGAGRGRRTGHHHGGRLALLRWRELRATGSVAAMPAAGPADGGAAAEAAIGGALAEHGVELPVPPDGPVVRMVDQEIVREQFYTHTPADGTPEQKGEFRRKRFNRAIDWAEDQQLIAIEEIGGVTYLRLTRPDPQDEEED